MASDFSVPDFLVQATDAPPDPPDPAEGEWEAARRYGRILSASSTASRALAELDGRFAEDPDFATAPQRYREALDAIGRDGDEAFGQDRVGRAIFRRDLGRLAENAVERFQHANAGREAAHLARALEDRWESLAVLARGAGEGRRAEILRQAALEAHRVQGFGLVSDADTAFRGFLARIAPVSAQGGQSPPPLQPMAGKAPPATQRQKPAPPPAESPLSDAERGRMIDGLGEPEGGKSNNPKDRGGLTHYGVTAEGLADYKQRAAPDDPIAKKEVSELTKADTRVIFDERMRQYRVDRIEDPHLRQHIFDMVANHPPGTAIRMWQKALNESGMLPNGQKVEEDGVLGPATRQALNGLNSEQRRVLNNAMVDNRLRFYEAIIKNDPTQEEFRRGWWRRENRFRLRESNVVAKDRGTT